MVPGAQGKGESNEREDKENGKAKSSNAQHQSTNATRHKCRNITCATVWRKNRREYWNLKKHCKSNTGQGKKKRTESNTKDKTNGINQGKTIRP